MTSASSPSMKKVYGKAFLIHLNKGDVETAKVFARAMLLAENGPENGPANGPNGYF